MGPRQTAQTPTCMTGKPAAELGNNARVDESVPGRNMKDGTADRKCSTVPKPVTLTECVRQAGQALDQTIAEIAAMGDAQERQPQSVVTKI